MGMGHNTMTIKTKQAERNDAIKETREILERSTKDYDGRPIVYTVLRHCSASGMTRYLDLFTIVEGAPRRITWKAAQILGWTYDKKRDALKVGGCGMDFGFHSVYTLARYVYRDANMKDAGYAIRHEWL